MSQPRTCQPAPTEPDAAPEAGETPDRQVIRTRFECGFVVAPGHSDRPIHRSTSARQPSLCNFRASEAGGPCARRLAPDAAVSSGHAEVSAASARQQQVTAGAARIAWISDSVPYVTGTKRVSIAERRLTLAVHASASPGDVAQTCQAEWRRCTMMRPLEAIGLPKIRHILPNFRQGACDRARPAKCCGGITAAAAESTRRST